MKRLKFDSQGKLMSLQGTPLDFEKPSKEPPRKLKTSASLEFLKPESSQEMEEIFDNSSWNLNDKEKFITPLKFSNGKTQEDIVKEIINLIKQGTKIILLHGACGTGKSAIALNLARILGKTSIVVPVKNLQRQYEEDYMGDKFLLKPNGKKMKIAMLTGKENHDSLIFPGKSCAFPELPENIKITEKNYEKLAGYFKENPFLTGRETPELNKIKRLSIAPANPYWSPILPADYTLNQLKDAKKIKYLGSDRREYIFYHRKPGCSYYDQYLAYDKADVIIFNAAKYNAEISIGRKPLTEVDVIDEADEYLDKLFNQEELNLTRLANALTKIVPDTLETREIITKIQDLIKLEEKNKRATGIDESLVFHVEETKIKEILNILKKDKELEAEIILDELNYANKALEISKNLSENLDETYLTYRKEEDNLYARLVSINLSGKINDLMHKTKAIVLMSGTIHSKTILKNIFGIKDFKIVEAETINQGGIDITKTGKEFDCKYSNFNTKKHSREEYLDALSSSISKAKLPVLIHVNAYQDLPTEHEKYQLNLHNLMSQEKLRELQREDKTGRAVSSFKQGVSDTLFSTKCNRGVDFPNEICNSIIFTKYPNPNVSDTFWKILQKTHPSYYWDFYKDKAYREFLQRIYRALRSQDDHVFILSPDERVLKAVQDLQITNEHSN
ncbi:MAG: helicase C-terminal domain-containing protein [Candidatus Pacearchaeota archaeon]|nr:helicase C-terminal domain-containing protein [Candidatus Pacearchaeota archaeon]